MNQHILWAIIQEIQTDKNFYTKHAASDGLNGTLNVNSTGVVGIQNGGPSAPELKDIYLDNSFPITPVAGLHVIRITTGTDSFTKKIEIANVADSDDLCLHY